MRLAALAALLARAVASQPKAVLDDLERRAGAALDAIPRPATRSEIEAQREPLRLKLEESLGIACVRYADAVPALLDLPGTDGARTPAIVLRGLHDRLDLLPRGITPQGLVQRAVRNALAYLLSRPDVDGQRIGLLGARPGGDSRRGD